MKNVTGIYIIKNTINSKVYIGQSVRCKNRWEAHLSAARSGEGTEIHVAMRNLGIENFSCEILEECKEDQLDEKESYYVEKYNSVKEGYNMKAGGNGCSGERNPRVRLRKEDVIKIRKMYANHVRMSDAYALYADRISLRGFQKIWRNETWPNILQEVYSKENMEWHRTKAKGNKQERRNNRERACSREEVEKILELRSAGKTYSEIAEETGRSTSTILKWVKKGEYLPVQECVNRVRVKNLETGLVFESLALAAEWSGCTPKNFSARLQKE